MSGAEMRISKCLLVFLILTVALSACNQDKKESLGQPQEMSLELEERFKDAERSLSDLSKLNLNWLQNNSGWLNYKVIPNEDGEPKFGFTRQDCWYLLEKGLVIKGLQIVFSDALDKEVQRFVINPDGYRGELLELRENGLSAQTYAIPYPANWQAENLSWAYMDLTIFRSMKEFIIDIEEKEIIYEGIPCLNIRVRYGGDTELRALGLPPGYEKIGKEENYYYALDTGNRLAYSRAFINEDNTIDVPCSFSEDWFPKADISQEVLEEVDLGLEELDFYMRLFEIQ